MEQSTQSDTQKVWQGFGKVHGAMSQVWLQVNITSTGLLGGWVSADPFHGTLRAGQSQVVTLKYDVSQSEFQGMYEADILITTTGQPLAKVRLFFAHIPFPFINLFRVCIYVVLYKMRLQQIRKLLWCLQPD